MRKHQKIVKKTEKILPSISIKTNEELLALIRIKKDLPTLLAVLSEGCFRTTGLRPYKEQLLCVLALFFGFAADMKTGEGKSLCAALCGALHAIHGRKTHIATVNDYLADRDRVTWEPFFCFFHFSTEANYRKHPDKKSMYSVDVLYSAGSELIFDYLQNEITTKEQRTLVLNCSQNEITAKEQRMEIPMDCAIIDEMDFILLDNANSLFSISTEFRQSVNAPPFLWAKEFSLMLKGYRKEKDFTEDEEEDPKGFHYVYIPHNKDVYLTDEGFDFFEQVFSDVSLYFYKILINTLEAQLFYQKDRDYLILDEEIVLINSHNGRLMPQSQLESDLHSAIETKEGLALSEKPLYCNSMSYQQFFIKYKSMAGMSGTLTDADEELAILFGKKVLTIPPHKKNIRMDLDTLFFKKKTEKYQYLLNLLDAQPALTQPFLIVAESEEEALFIYNLIRPRFLHAVLLSAVDVSREEDVIKGAGQAGAITISTNLVGRGTDIVIDDEAESLGGLFVVCLNHYPSRRIDNQVRGRAARQGVRGICVFLSSFEDEIFLHLDKTTKKYSINHLQNQLDALSATSRKKFFEMESVLEEIKGRVTLWKRDMAKSPLPCMEDVILELGGEEITRLLYLELLDAVSFKQWLIFRKDMEAMRMYILNYRLTEERIIPEYIRNCFREFEEFKQDVLQEVGNLLSLAKRAKNPK